MARKWTDKGADVPLFDKLVDEDPQLKEESPVFKRYDRQELLFSVQKIHSIIRAQLIMIC